MEIAICLVVGLLAAASLVLWLQSLQWAVQVFLICAAVSGVLAFRRWNQRRQAARAAKTEAEEEAEVVTAEPRHRRPRMRVAPREGHIMELLAIGIGIASAILAGVLGITNIWGSIILGLMGLGGVAIARPLRNLGPGPVVGLASVALLVALFPGGILASRALLEDPGKLREQAWQELVKENPGTMKIASGKDFLLKAGQAVSAEAAVKAAEQVVSGIFGAGVRAALDALKDSGIAEDLGITLGEEPAKTREEKAVEKVVREKTQPDKRYHPANLSPRQKGEIEAAIERLDLGPNLAALYRGEFTSRRVEDIRSRRIQETLGWLPFPLVASLILFCLVPGQRNEEEKVEGPHGSRRMAV